LRTSTAGARARETDPLGDAHGVADGVDLLAIGVVSVPRRPLVFGKDRLDDRPEHEVELA